MALLASRGSGGGVIDPLSLGGESGGRGGTSGGDEATSEGVGGGGSGSSLTTTSPSVKGGGGGGGGRSGVDDLDTGLMGGARWAAWMGGVWRRELGVGVAVTAGDDAGAVGVASGDLGGSGAGGLR